MAIAGFILGGICGTIAALVGGLFFGIGLMAALQLYFLTGFGVAFALICGVMLLNAAARPRTEAEAKAY